MAILVTGGAGYIGSDMVWCLLDATKTLLSLIVSPLGFAGR